MVWVGKVFLTCLFLRVKQIETTKCAQINRKPSLGTVGCNISGNEIGQTLSFSFCARQHTHDSFSLE